MQIQQNSVFASLKFISISFSRAPKIQLIPTVSAVPKIKKIIFKIISMR